MQKPEGKTTLWNDLLNLAFITVTRSGVKHRAGSQLKIKGEICVGISSLIEIRYP